MEIDPQGSKEVFGRLKHNFEHGAKKNKNVRKIRQYSEYMYILQITEPIYIKFGL